MATVEELKEMIVNLKVWLRESYIPHGNCPYCYFSVEGSTRECGSIDCDLCQKSSGKIVIQDRRILLWKLQENMVVKKLPWRYVV